jgi:hypothetical protein
VVLNSQLARIPWASGPGCGRTRWLWLFRPSYRAAPDDPASPALTRRLLCGEVAVVGLDGGRVMGLVTVSDPLETYWPVHEYGAGIQAG